MNIEQKFWNNVNVRGDTWECWEWTAGQNSDGYGNFNFPNKTKSAHRVAWILTYGPIPMGICVLHSCDNPSCCNPEHLFLGTNQDNMNDLAEKGHLKGELRFVANPPKYESAMKAILTDSNIATA